MPSFRDDAIHVYTSYDPEFPNTENDSYIFKPHPFILFRYIVLNLGLIIYYVS